jgi:hypothetical protein
LSLPCYVIFLQYLCHCFRTLLWLNINSSKLLHITHYVSLSLTNSLFTIFCISHAHTFSLSFSLSHDSCSVVVVDFLDITYLSPFFKTLLSSNIIPSIVLTISYYLSHYHVLTLSLPFTIFLTITSYLSYCLSQFFSLYLTHIHFLSHIIILLFFSKFVTF